jgi:hypothetical protein
LLPVDVAQFIFPPPQAEREAKPLSLEGDVALGQREGVGQIFTLFNRRINSLSTLKFPSTENKK